MGKLTSGRVKRVPQVAITSDRYEFLGLDQAEPNLGDPLVGPSSVGAKPVPPGQRFIIVSTGTTGDRYWIPDQAGIIPGSISIFNEATGSGQLVGGLSSTTQLVLIGNSINAVGFLNNDGTPAPNVNITVSPPGNNGDILFKESNDFATSPKLVFNSSAGIVTVGNGLNVGTGGTIFTVSSTAVGINTSNPTQELDLNGDLRLRGTIYDSNNNPGQSTELLVRNNTGGLIWIGQGNLSSGAGGTVTNIQYHNTSGLIDGASNFVFDFVNNRVGIGSTQPKSLLDVIGISSFTGGVNIDRLNVSGVSTFTGITTVTGETLFTKQLNVSGLSTFAGITTVTGTTLFAKQLNVSGVTTSTTFIGAFTGNVTGNINAPGVSTFTGTIDANGDLDVDGRTDLDDLIVSENLYVVGLTTLSGATRVDQTFRVYGNTTLSNTSITNLTSQQVNVTGLSTFAGITTVTGAKLFSKQLDIAGSSTFGGIATVTGPTLFTKQLDVAGVSTFNGDIFTDIDEAHDIGTLYKKFNVIYAKTFFGEIIGNSESATSVLGGIADVAILKVAGVSTFFGNIIAGQNEVYNIGSSGSKFLNVYANTFNGNITGANGNIISLTGVAATITTLNSTTLNTTNINLTGIITASSANITYLDVTDSAELNELYVDGTAYFNSIVSLGASLYTQSIIPIVNNTYSLGVSTCKWSHVYSDFFTGTFIGNVDTATKLATPRNIAVTGDLAWNVTFDGSTNVTAAGILANTGVSAATYGSATTVPVFAVDAKGRITSVTNTGITNSGTADKLTTPRNIAVTGDLAWNVTFDGSANVTAAGILAATGVSAATYGSATTVPVFAVDAKGRITSVTNTGINFAGATVASADKLTIARNIIITGDLSWNVSFDGTANVSSVGTLATLNPNPAGTYGSAVLIPQFTVDGKGRVTSVTNTAVNFGSQTVANADKLTTARTISMSGNASDVTWNVSFDGSGNVTNPATLKTITGLTPNTYGTSTTIPQFTVDAKGRVTAISDIGIDYSAATVSQADRLTVGKTISITGDLAYTSPVFDGVSNITAVGTLANTGVTAATYGSTTTIPQFAVDAKGRITSVTNVGVNYSAATVAQADKLTTSRNIAVTGD